MVFFLAFLLACSHPAAETQNLAQQGQLSPVQASPSDTIIPGAERWELVETSLKGKRVGLVVNHTSRSGGQHLVDRMLEHGIEVKRVFAPEHGFRGQASDGEKIENQVDARTGLSIVSLYGKTKRPTEEMLADLDVLVFDIQDVGLRFYTYLSTMHYVMDAAAQYGKKVLVLDRPNPNGKLVDGPVLDTAYRSFIGMHPIPVSHGMTLGELAQMINGEGWLSGARKADLEIVPVKNYQVGEPYVLPIAPSPNLPNQNSIYLYPTLCFFEGTEASVGRGTDFPFEVIGHPAYKDQSFSFTPESRPGAKYAPLQGKLCYGLDLRQNPNYMPSEIDWDLIRDFMRSTDTKTFIDRPKHLDALAGGPGLRNWLNGTSQSSAFRKGYAKELSAFLVKREQYLLYERN